MKLRIRTGPAPGSEPDYTFVEVEPDSWLEVNAAPDEITPENLAEFLVSLADFEAPKVTKGRKQRQFYVRFATRCFRIGLISDWREAGNIEIMEAADFTTEAAIDRHLEK